jgi:hypothetical protein
MQWENYLWAVVSATAGVAGASSFEASLPARFTE